MVKWGSIYHVQLHPRFEAWLQEIRDRHPHYTDEQILFAALACGLDWLRRDTKVAKKLKSFYPPETTAERFPAVALRILSGSISTHISNRPPRVYRGFGAGDGSGPW